MPLHTTEAGANDGDIVELLPLLAGAKILGLGEATHGTHEFYTLKHRFIEFLAHRTARLVVLTETSMVDARAVNRYVLDGVGDPAGALRGLRGWPWRVEEGLALIRWMREWNRAGTGIVEFWGVDVGDAPPVAMDSVLAYVRDVRPELQDSIAAIYRGLRSGWEGLVARRGTSEAHAVTAWEDGANAVLTLLSRAIHARADTSSDDREAWALQYAELVAQGGGFLSRTSRDQSMAENVEWIVAQHPPGVAYALWAHNTHVARQPGAMGQYLAAGYGSGYRPIAMTFGNGAYKALSSGGLTNRVAPPPTAGGVEAALAEVPMPVFAVDVRNVAVEPDGSWLATTRPMHRAGGDVPVNVVAQFDGVIFVHSTTPTRTLPRRP